MQPFMDIRGLTPPAGRLKCLWVRGADGRLESVWVPDWELDERELAARAEASARRAG